MDKNEMCMEEISCIKDTVVSAFKSVVSGGIESLDIKEASETADIIKDLAQAEKECLEAKYYKTVIEAMEGGEEARYGYNSNRYSNGRYAPKGRGMMGYKPYIDQEPYIDAYMRDPRFEETMNDRMGYSNSNWHMSPDSGRYGKAYNEYREAKRHYTSSNSEADKNEMKMHANEHITDMIATVRDIWSNADPDHKKHMKKDLTALLEEMSI